MEGYEVLPDGVSLPPMPGPRSPPTPPLPSSQQCIEKSSCVISRRRVVGAAAGGVRALGTSSRVGR